MAKRRGKPPRIPQLGNHGLDDALYAYATEVSNAESEKLARLRRATWTQTIKPQMLCDELQGRLLSALSHMIAPDRILEIGTFTGYATACWAEGLSSNGVIDTIDHNDELHSIQDEHWKALGWHSCIRRHTGTAVDVLKSGTLFTSDKRLFDVVFIDADKENQQTYVDWAICHVCEGGWIVVDNVLWWGEVLRVVRGESNDPRAMQIHELNKYMSTHPDLDNVLLPLRDGLHIARLHPRPKS